jgi:hypothetical protein
MCQFCGDDVDHDELREHMNTPDDDPEADDGAAETAVSGSDDATND